MSKRVNTSRKSKKPILVIEKRIHRFSKPLYLVLLFIFTFSSSAFAKAVHKVKRAVRGTRSALKSSYSAYITARAWGYFRPFWEMKPEDFGDTSAQKEILSDPLHKVESEFQVPGKIKARVAFWVDVYSKFSTYDRIVHDRDNPEIIYGYIDFRPLYHNFPQQIADAKAHEIEKKILTELKGRLAEAAGIENNARSPLSPEEAESLKKFLAQLPADQTSDMKTLLKHVRTQTGQRDQFLKALYRSRKTMPQIEQLFREQGLPVALARLPFVESSFNSSAHSKSGAVGIWQIMPDTARLFDRKATQRERSEPIRQSKSAARFLRVLRERMPNWAIAVTAYNSGAARLDRIVKKYRVSDIEGLIDVPASKDTLGFAGKNFYCELLAANLVEAYQDRLFPPSVLQTSKLALSRRVQSLIERVTFTDNKAKSGIDRNPASKTLKRAKRVPRRHRSTRRAAASLKPRYSSARSAGHRKVAYARNGKRSG